MMRLAKLGFLFLGLLLTLTPSGALAEIDPIDAYVAAQMREQQIPGLALAVVRNGKLWKAKGYGLANVELGVPVTPDTVFQSGSVGKQLTAALVMMLVEDGKLKLDDPIAKYLPGSPAAFKGIRLRHLLSHTAGISNDLYEAIDMRQDYTEDQLFREIAALPLDFAPGERWNYSNPGYLLLGILIHKMTGVFYGDLLRQRIFEPLGMKTARIISEADIVKNRADGYELVEGELKNQEWVSPALNTTADGSLYLTLDDMVRWDAALTTEKLLKRSSLERMWQPVELAGGEEADYGFGWGISEVNGHRVIEHGGAWQGFRAYYGRFVDDGLSIILFANLDAADPESIGHGVAALLDPNLRSE